MIKVVNARNEPFDIYIGRPGPLGNPFVLGVHGDRAQVIELWRHYAVRRAKIDEEFKRKLMACDGKTLGCHCHPLPCHGDTFDEIINYLKEHP